MQPLTHKLFIILFFHFLAHWPLCIRVLQIGLSFSGLGKKIMTSLEVACLWWQLSYGWPKKPFLIESLSLKMYANVAKLPI